MTSGTSVSAISTLAMVEAATHLGVDGAAVLAEHGVDAKSLAAADARLPAALVPRLWGALIKASGDGALHLSAAARLPFGAYRVIDYLVSTSSRVEHGMGRLSRYFRLINNGVRLEVVEVGGLFGLEMGPAVGGRPLTRQYVEYTFAVTLAHFRPLSSPELSPARVEFMAPEPAYAQACAAAFDCPPSFGAAANRMLFTPEQWAWLHHTANPGVCEVLESHARLLLEKVPCEATVASRLTAFVGGQLVDGPPSLDDAARALAMSPRTLQRRLREEGLTYRDGVDQARQTLARQYLADPSVALCEVAFLLGFSEQSTFQRAFRRWMGTTPGAWRAQLSPAPRTRVA